MFKKSTVLNLVKKIASLQRERSFFAAGTRDAEQQQQEQEEHKGMP